MGVAFRADIVATGDRDPATDRFIDPVLYFKGFHAIQAHRLAHWLWGKGARTSLITCRADRRQPFRRDIPSGSEYRPRHFSRSRHRLVVARPR